MLTFVLVVALIVAVGLAVNAFCVAQAANIRADMRDRLLNEAIADSLRKDTSIAELTAAVDARNDAIERLRAEAAGGAITIAALRADVSACKASLEKCEDEYFRTLARMVQVRDAILAGLPIQESSSP